MNTQENFLQSGDIILPGIDEKIRLPEKTYFRYEEAVDGLHSRQIALTKFKIIGSIKDTRKKLSDLFQQRDHFNDVERHIIREADGLLDDHPNLDDYNGYCYKYQSGERSNVYYLIGKKKNLPLNLDLFTDGHESGELLNFIEQHQNLQSFLKKHNVNLDVSRFKGEDFADIGGMLALQKAVQKTGQTLDLPSFKNRAPVLPEITRAFNLKP